MSEFHLLDHKYFELQVLIENVYTYSKDQFLKAYDDMELKKTDPELYKMILIRNTGAFEAVRLIRDKAKNYLIL